MIARPYMLVAAAIVAGASSLCGFGLGARIGARDAARPDAEESAAADEARRGRPLSALPTSSNPRANSGTALRDIARDGKLGLFVKLRAYMRLANSTPLEDLAALLVQVERELPEELGGEVLIEFIGRRWAREDPHGAFAALLAGEPRALGDASHIIVAELAKADPERAWQSVLAAGATERRAQVLRELLGELGDSDMEGALARVAELPSPMLYRAQLQDFLEGAMQSDPAAVLRARDQLPPALLAGDGLRVAFATLAGRDRERAMEEFATIREPSARIAAARGLAGSWATTDPDAAAAWAKGLATPQERDVALAGIVDGLWNTDPAAAAAAVSNLRSPSLRIAQARQVAVQWSESDPDAAIAWVESGLEGSAREGAFEGILGEQGHKLDFERQLELADQIPGEGHARRGFVERWAENDPAAAAAWAVAQGEDNGQLLLEVYQQWADLDAAAAFAETVPEGPLREIAVGVIEARRNPTAADE